ncbi:hypothetical protein DPMN_001389 [Dreissena polymorpha]|uniref:Uncharacterized protein n=1 Tax=Dreissena polymorpha TaxID=45954 RepID=A0A9D4RQB5_DREPO|nr:hypothetical protein DPMN_001389 [Dreissena polymorpha]
MTDSETALNTRPAVSRGSVSLQYESYATLTMVPVSSMSDFDNGTQDYVACRTVKILPLCREDRCLCRLHGIEHPGQTDTFRTLSETELEPRNHRSRKQFE